MFYYEVIAGSRSYGLEIEQSDVDLCRVSDTWNMGATEGEYNILQIPKDEFVHRVIGDHSSVYYLQWLFPYKVSSNNALTTYLQENREKIVHALLPYIYRVFWTTANGLKMYADWLYELYPKRLAYSAHFYSLLANYADGMSFAQAHVAQDELRNELLAMRKKEIVLSDAITICEEQKKRAEAASDFYQAEKDEIYLNEVASQMRRLMGC